MPFLTSLTMMLMMMMMIMMLMMMMVMMMRLALSIVNRVSTALLYGRLAAQNGGSRPYERFSCPRRFGP
jgi:hypothetical protein